MRHHDFIQKKVLGYLNDFYLNYEKNNTLNNQEKEEWNEFLEKINNFDSYDNYIDLLDLEDLKIASLQYFYSHVDDNGAIGKLEQTSESNVWIKDNMEYYKRIEKVITPLLIEGEN